MAQKQNGRRAAGLFQSVQLSCLRGLCSVFLLLCLHRFFFQPSSLQLSWLLIGFTYNTFFASSLPIGRFVFHHYKTLQIIQVIFCHVKRYAHEPAKTLDCFTPARDTNTYIPKLYSCVIDGQPMILIYGVQWVGHCPPILKKLYWEPRGGTQISARVAVKLVIQSNHHFACFFFFFLTLESVKQKMIHYPGCEHLFCLQSL